MAALSEEAEDHMKSATAWALGQLGRHTPDHAKAVADTGVLPLLVTLENDAHSTEDLKGKCRKALKAIVAKLTFMPALDALVHRFGLLLLLCSCCCCCWCCSSSMVSCSVVKLLRQNHWLFAVIGVVVLHADFHASFHSPGLASLSTLIFGAVGLT